MKDIQEQVNTALMDKYSEIVGEDPYERWPGVFFPQVLAEYIHRSEDVLQITFHIGVEEENEELIEGIKERINLVLHSLDLGAKLYDAGESPTNTVAVNEKENTFLQKPVHWILSTKEVDDPKKFVL